MNINVPINNVVNTNGQVQSKTIGSSSATINGTITFNKNTKGGETSETLAGTLTLPYTTETWTFTLSDQTTVTKTIVVPVTP